MAIVVSGPPDHCEGKLLGAPCAANATGENEANTTYQIVKSWGISDNIKAMCYDTTFSNTGAWKGACVRLEELLNKKLIMCACRHHILELIINGAYSVLFGGTKSPINEEFEKFRDKWECVDKSLQYISLTISNRGLKTKSEKVASFLKSRVQCQFDRDDYLKCTELSLIMLGVLPPRGVRFRRPGAISHARWMSKILYSLKMYLFQDQLEYDQQLIMKLEKICLFIVLVYVPSWLNASSGVDAAVHDLQLWKDIKFFAEIDKNISEAATIVLKRHFWYLTEEMSIFALFSEKLSLNERQTIAKELLRYKKPNSNTIARGIPEFPLITENTRIWRCIGEKS